MISGVGPKLRPLHAGLESDGSHIFEAQNGTLLMKKALEKLPIWKKLNFGLLEHEVDIVSEGYFESLLLEGHTS